MITILSWTLCGERDAALLPETLRAVAPIVDRSLVVWTGETPAGDTYGVLLAEFGTRFEWEYWPWDNDFAEARNAALGFAAEVAPGGWGLMLDADERVICPDPAALRAYLAALPAEVDVVVCYAADGSHGRERLFRLPCPHKWIGRTHESIPVGSGKQAQAPASLIAWEERKKTPEQLRAKFERDERLLAAEIAEHPDDARWHAYRGASLAGLARYQEAVDEYRAASMLGHGEDSVTACYRAADLLLNTLHRPDEAIAAVCHGMALNPTYAELPWVASNAAMHLGRPDMAIAWARIAEVHGERGAGKGAMLARVGHRFPHALNEGPNTVQRAARMAMGPRDRVRVVVFSKDRPMQLDACLRSFRLHCEDIDAVSVCVIAKATTQAFGDAYAELDAATPWARFFPEHDFREGVLFMLSRCDHVLFVVDDTVFVRRFRVGGMVDALEAAPDAIGYSLRLGRNCTWTYPTNRAQTVPGLDCLSEPTGYLFSWPEADGDFGYPLEVSSSLFRSADILAILRLAEAAGQSVTNPNTLEFALAAHVGGHVLMGPRSERLLCPPLSLAFSIPANRVQDVVANRAGTDPAMTAAALLALWQDGYRIDVAALAGHTPAACHEEVPYRFERKPRIESVERPIRITVTSTAINAAAWAPRCIRSVQEQTFAARHVYIAADAETLAAARLAERGVGLGALGIGPAADNVETSGERKALRVIRDRVGEDARRILVLDVGANRGEYTRIAREELGPQVEVYAFEPSHDAAALIRGAASVLPYALSDAEGTAEMHADVDGSGLASLHPRAMLRPSARVRTRTVDDVCAELGIAWVDLLKIDVEGHELAVLRGARRMIDAGNIDAIQFEFGGCAVDSRIFLRDFFRLLGDRYQIHRVTPRGIFPVDYSEREEVFVSTNFLALRCCDARWEADSDVRNGIGKPLLANLLPVWRSLPDDEVIAWVDGDDWLATDQALAPIAQAHRAGALATYGSFMHADGSLGFAAQADGDVRSGAWLTTHLKTFRAGLVKRIADEHLRRPDGRYVDLAVDQAVMIPCVEMAGERALYVPQVTYTYNSGHAWEATASPEERAREVAEVRRIRAQRRYGRLTWPPVSGERS